MPILLGVDTGGTYTDAVLYDEATNRVLGKAKATTDHDDLSRGIGQAIDAALIAAGIAATDIGLVSLSTTLATNALVEDLGRRACLIMVGFDSTSLAHDGLRTAIADNELIVTAGGHSSYGEEIERLDISSLTEAILKISDSVEAFAVTSQFSVRNPAHEQAVSDLIHQHTGLPVTCSHELSAELNGPKRGVTALLNARLIALIDELLDAADAMLLERGIDAPVMIVRGNGSLVAADFIRGRPVETILSGPAASLVGATHLTDVTDGVIVDIGGTTTDIAVLRDGQLQLGPAGAIVGGHKTMVEAVLMSTHGIGGDSEVRLADRSTGADLLIGPRRVVPLALLGVDHPDFLHKMLERQLLAEPPGEFDGLVILPSQRGHTTAALSTAETTLRGKIGAEPIAADSVLTSRVSVSALQRLKQLGFLRLAAFTPTDATHVLRLQDGLDPIAARLGATLFAQRRDRHGEAIAASPEEISRVVVDTLVRRSAEVVLAAALRRDGLPDETGSSQLISSGLDGHIGAARVDIGVSIPLVGLGAPAQTYYPLVANLLGTTSSVPADADVANAIGAVVGRVRITRVVTISAPRRGIYRVHLGTDPETFADLDDAKARALVAAQTLVTDDAEAAGGRDIQIESSWAERSAVIQDRPYFVEGTLTVTASGRPRLNSTTD